MTGRLEAFSDGVFAIAATLLILDVKAEGLPLGPALLGIWPSYAAYATSFLTIGIIWINHHTVVEQIGRVDRTFLMLNVVFLMVVAFIPFPTRLLADHLRDDGAEAAALAYGINLTLTAATFNAVAPVALLVLLFRPRLAESTRFLVPLRSMLTSLSLLFTPAFAAA